MSAAAEVFATPSILLMILERLPTSTNLVMLDRTSKVFRLVLRHQVFDKRMGRSLRVKPLPPPSLRSTLWKPPPGSSKAQAEMRKAERASADADKAKTEKAAREKKSREDKAKPYRGKADKAKERQVKEEQAKEARARPEKDASEPKEKKRKTGTSRMAGQSAGRKDKFQHYRRTKEELMGDDLVSEVVYENGGVPKRYAELTFVSTNVFKEYVQYTILDPKTSNMGTRAVSKFVTSHYQIKPPTQKVADDMGVHVRAEWDIEEVVKKSRFPGDPPTFRTGKLDTVAKLCEVLNDIKRRYKAPKIREFALPPHKGSDETYLGFRVSELEVLVEKIYGYAKPRRGDVSQLIRCIVFPVNDDGDCVVGNRPDSWAAEHEAALPPTFDWTSVNAVRPPIWGHPERMPTGPEMRPYISWMLVHRRVPGKDVFRNKAHARKVGSTYDPQLTTIHEVLVEEYLWPKLDFARLAQLEALIPIVKEQDFGYWSTRFLKPDAPIKQLPRLTLKGLLAQSEFDSCLTEIMSRYTPESSIHGPSSNNQINMSLEETIAYMARDYGIWLKIDQAKAYRTRYRYSRVVQSGMLSVVASKPQRWAGVGLPASEVVIEMITWIMDDPHYGIGDYRLSLQGKTTVAPSRMVFLLEEVFGVFMRRQQVVNLYLSLSRAVGTIHLDGPIPKTAVALWLRKKENGTITPEDQDSLDRYYLMWRFGPDSVAAKALEKEGFRGGRPHYASQLCQSYAEEENIVVTQQAVHQMARTSVAHAKRHDSSFSYATLVIKELRAIAELHGINMDN